MSLSKVLLIRPKGYIFSNQFIFEIPIFDFPFRFFVFRFSIFVFGEQRKQKAGENMKDLEQIRKTKKV